MNIHIPSLGDMLGLPDLRTITVLSQPDEKLIVVQSLLDRPACPSCTKEPRWVHKHGPIEQEFRDIPHGEPTVLKLRRNRFKCSSCGHTWMEKIPSLDDGRLMTKRLRQFIVKRCLKDTNYSVADDVGLDESTIRAVFKDFVEEMERNDRRETPPVLGIDEIHLKGALCVLTDLEGKKIFDLLPSRTKDYLDPYLGALPGKERVKVVVADMWRPYHDLARVHFPGRPVVVDKFHVVRFAQKGLDEIRKRTGRRLKHEQKIRLKDERFLLLTRERSLTDEEWHRIQPWLAEFPDLRAAYETKERLSALYEVGDRDEAARLLGDCLRKIPSHLDGDFEGLLSIVKNWRPEILAYFDHRFTNGFTEGVNAAIRQIDRQGRGYSFDVLRARLLYKEVTVKGRSSIRRKPRRHDDSMSFMVFGAEDRDVVYERLIVPATTTYRRRTIAEFQTELAAWLLEEPGASHPDQT
ncbi:MULTISPECIES: ISL3 family transposase [Hyphomicrobiales]|jgi:transposase|uniref:ISL3 family transposase n=1 Tax=Methylobacterium sp. CCH7-A2 TaxID=1768789 RepID=UPI00082B9927|nr:MULTISPECIES: ISL3 family transposase [Hyphomicrobiales]